MVAPKHDLLRWIRLALTGKATHLIVFMESGFMTPRFVRDGEDVQEVVQKLKDAEAAVVSVFDLRVQDPYALADSTVPVFNYGA